MFAGRDSTPTNIYHEHITLFGPFNINLFNFYLTYRNAMDSKATLLVPPNVKNVSCSHPRYTGSLIYYIGPFDAIQALLILMLTVGIIGANLLVIFVINHRRYSPYIHPQVMFAIIFGRLFHWNRFTFLNFRIWSDLWIRNRWRNSLFNSSFAMDRHNIRRFWFLYVATNSRLYDA